MIWQKFNRLSSLVIVLMQNKYECLLVTYLFTKTVALNNS